jgi:hypothetical protein
MHEVIGGSDREGGSHYQQPQQHCPCQLFPKPDIDNKAATARWMVHSLEWGVLTTISSRSNISMMPFGNVYSFVDGSCNSSTGIPYFYATHLDQSFQDLRRNPYASLTLSEASLATVCHGSLHAACDASTRGSGGYYGDVESPVCARLTLSGKIAEIASDTDEFAWAQQALFERHPDMKSWVRRGWARVVVVAYG